MNRTTIARRAGVLTAGTAMAMLLLTGPAHAAETWTYTCDKTTFEADEFGGGKSVGTGHCTPSNGAPKTGKIKEEFLLVSRDDTSEVRCADQENGKGAGTAALPGKVTGIYCKDTSR